MNEPDPHRAHVDDDADEPTRDAVVIGGGAAGLSAALLLARARLRVAVVDAGSPRNAPAAHMQGYLSRDGLAPGELLATGRAEVVAYGGELVDGTVQAALPGFRVRLTDGRVLRARRLLVATGLRDELPTCRAWPRAGGATSCSAPTATATRSATRRSACWPRGPLRCIRPCWSRSGRATWSCSSTPTRCPRSSVSR